MIVAAALCVAAWLIGGAAGWAFDPFLPLVATVALRRRWSTPERLAAIVALGPVTAIACGDVLLERTLLYGSVALVATQGGLLLRDGVLARTLLVAASLGVVLGFRGLLAATGALPPPAETLAAVTTTVLWTAGHALLTVRRPLRRQAPAPVREAA